MSEYRPREGRRRKTGQFYVNTGLTSKGKKGGKQIVSAQLGRQARDVIGGEKKKGECLCPPLGGVQRQREKGKEYACNRRPMLGKGEVYRDSLHG